MKRKQTVHDVKRRLKAKLLQMSPIMGTQIIAELREFAIARRFYGGASVENLEHDEQIGAVAWGRRRIESAIRSQRRAAR